MSEKPKKNFSNPTARQKRFAEITLQSLRELEPRGGAIHNPAYPNLDDDAPCFYPHPDDPWSYGGGIGNRDGKRHPEIESALDEWWKMKMGKPHDKTLAQEYETFARANCAPSDEESAAQREWWKQRNGRPHDKTLADKFEAAVQRAAQPPA